MTLWERHCALASEPGVVMVFYTVYRQPTDFPNHIVVRAQAATDTHDVRPAILACLYDTVDEANAEYREFGMHWMPRWNGDEPQIVGTWL